MAKKRHNKRHQQKNIQTNEENSEIKYHEELHNKIELTLKDESNDKPDDTSEANTEEIITTNSIDSVSSKKTQENNEHIIPTSSRKDVEVDKIFQLLQDAKNELKNKNHFKKERQDRIEKIINDIPPESLSKLSQEAIPDETHDVPEEDEVITPIHTVEKNETEEKHTAETISHEKYTSNKSSHLISYLLSAIVLILGFLLFDITQNKQSNTQTQNNFTFEDLEKNIQEQYVNREQMLKIQAQTKELMSKSKLLIEKNQLQNAEISRLTLEVQKSAIPEKEVSNNRNLLKENILLKKEQSIYSNKLIALKLKNKEQTEKTALIEEELKSLQVQNQAKKVLSNKSTNTITLNENQKKINSSKYQQVLDKEVFPATISTSKNYTILKCYDLKPGEFYLSAKCKKDIEQFVSKNSNALRFEVIGVVDNTDFTSVYKHKVDTKEALELRKYTAMGLARYRVLETSWFLNEQQKNITLTPVNYTLTSKKSNRGSIVRAYYK
mgnify:CR=1 FL=1